MSTQVATRERSDIHELREQFSKMSGEFKVALPSHIPTERFQRVAMTAVQRNPDLLLADRKSLMQACMMAAQDGLMPDGREAALVIFKTNIAKKGQPAHWVPLVQYMPMVFGIRKKVYQSGEITSLVARIAFENDEFEVIYGDDERIKHKPSLFSRGNMIAVYAIAVYKNSSKAREVMTIDDVEQVRRISKNSDAGPWRDWYEEMAKKTVIRRLSKSLPLSSELDDFMRRDDSFYDLDQSPSQSRRLEPIKPQTIEARLDQFAQNGNDQPTRGDETESSASSSRVDEAESEEAVSASHASDESASSPVQQQDPDPRGGDADSAPAEQMSASEADAYERGRAARQSKYGRATPRNLKDKEPESRAFLRGWDDEAAETMAEESGTV